MRYFYIFFFLWLIRPALAQQADVAPKNDSLILYRLDTIRLDQTIRKRNLNRLFRRPVFNLYPGDIIIIEYPKKERPYKQEVLIKYENRVPNTNMDYLIAIYMTNRMITKDYKILTDSIFTHGILLFNRGTVNLEKNVFKYTDHASLLGWSSDKNVHIVHYISNFDGSLDKIPSDSLRNLIKQYPAIHTVYPFQSLLFFKTVKKKKSTPYKIYVMRPGYLMPRPIEEVIRERYPWVKKDYTIKLFLIQ